MRFEGSHTTRYVYSAPVFIEPLTLRLRPRTDPGQRLDAFELEVEPEPAGMSEGIDAFGNSAAWLWFSGTHTELRIATSFSVTMLRSNPFDYVLPDEGLGVLPMRYPDRLGAGIGPYLERAGPDEEVDDLSDDVAAASDGRVLGFLAGLTDRIYERFEVVVREEGDPWTPTETLQRSEASCRDLAVLYVDACRAQGIAARFVSGYQEGDPDQAERDLHAWAEAYVPGGGWRGYDPTLGLAVADRHIALASGPHPGNAAPMCGTYRRTGASSELVAEITLRAIHDEETTSTRASL